jgi:hypothetical protein
VIITSVGFDRVRNLMLAFTSFALCAFTSSVIVSCDLVVSRCFLGLDILGL